MRKTEGEAGLGRKSRSLVLDLLKLNLPASLVSRWREMCKSPGKLTSGGWFKFGRRLGVNCKIVGALSLDMSHTHME